MEWGAAQYIYYDVEFVCPRHILWWWWWMNAYSTYSSETADVACCLFSRTGRTRPRLQVRVAGGLEPLRTDHIYKRRARVQGSCVPCELFCTSARGATIWALTLLFLFIYSYVLVCERCWSSFLTNDAATTTTTHICTSLTFLQLSKAMMHH